jgi:hypothetical protein
MGSLQGATRGLFHLAAAFTVLGSRPALAANARSGKPAFGPQTSLLYLPLANGETLEFTLEQLMAGYHVPGWAWRWSIISRTCGREVSG